MDCEKVRDRFSSLWEKELTPIEKKTVEEHLSSCPACQREFEQFEKTMRWLQSCGEVEAPDQFLPELLKKMEERKRITPDKRATERWFNFPRSFKLPAQAVAMVAIVFIVLYITKMMPTEKYLPEEEKEKKPEHALVEKEGGSARVALKAPSEAPRQKDIEQTQSLVQKERRLEEASVPQVKAEAPSPEPEKVERELVRAGEPLVAQKPHQEIVLKTSDREKALSQINELVKQFRGEIVAKEEGALIASLPRSTFSEFKKELTELSPSTQANKLFLEKPETRDLMKVEGLKKEAADEKGKESATLAEDAAHRTIVRILLIQE
jgi:hypothetical protein